MGLKWAIEGISWRTHYDAMLRWASRCESCYSDGRCVSRDGIDFLLAFFLFSYHLRDYVIATGGVSQLEIDKLINASKNMRICRDVCNRTKHYKLSKPASIDSFWSLGREWAPYPDGAGGISNFLIAGNEKLAPIVVVRACVEFWDNVISSGSLQEPATHLVR